MTRSTTRLMLTLALLALPACAELNQKLTPNSKAQAQQRWSDVRARLKLQLASESFNAGKLEDAQKHAEEAIGLAPTSCEAFTLLARILIERGQIAAASEALQQARTYGDGTAELDYLDGMVAQRYGRLEEALVLYQRAANRDKTQAPYVVAVAETLVALQRHDEALSTVRARWIDFERNATLRALAGEVLSLLGRYEEAAAAFRDASRIAPDDEVLQYRLGSALNDAHQYREAFTVLSAAVKKATDPSAGVLIDLGFAAVEAGQPEEAKAAFRRATELEADNRRAWTGLCRAALACEDLLTARRAAMKAVDLDRDNPECRLLLGYVCWRQQDYRPAIESLETVRHEGETLPIALYLLAHSHQRLGNTRSVQQYCRQALELQPDCPWARELMKSDHVSMK